MSYVSYRRHHKDPILSFYIPLGVVKRIVPQRLIIGIDCVEMALIKKNRQRVNSSLLKEADCFRGYYKML